MSSPITADWQYRLVERDFLIGNGTNYDIRFGTGVHGTMGAHRHTVTVEHGTADGRAFGNTWNNGSDITIPVQLEAAPSAVTTRQRAHALSTGWRKLQTGELELEAREPGTPATVMSYFGKPGVIDPSAENYLFGLLVHLCTFECSDAYAYGPAVATADKTATFTIDDSDCGDLEADTDRVIFSVTVDSGSEFTLLHDTGHVTVEGVAAADVVVIDLHNMTCTRNGTAADQLVTDDSDWFFLNGGVDNEIEVDGDVTIDVSHRPAYHR